MREIVHFHLGPRASHLATHQWNTAESLFSFSDEDVDHGVEHDVDWRQGVSSRNGEETYMPRMILVDLKENFGALPNINALYGTESDDEEETDDEEQPKRTEPKPQRLQVGEPIAPSPYQTYLSSTSDDPTPAGPPELANPRYWSDYNRVFYHPRSLLPLEPRFRRTTAEDENGMAKWDEGLEAWDSLRKSEEMEDSFRLFAEEADLLQGVQLGVDMSTGFGALAGSVVQEIVKQEFPKTDVFAVGLLGAMGESKNPWAGMQRVFNEASTLLSLTASNAVVLPLSDLSHADSSSFPLPVDLSSPFETSALLSSHLTSVLMPLRSKVDRGRMGMSELVSGLNWRGDTRMAELEGSVPVWDVESADKANWDFSTFRKEVKEGEKPDERVTPFYRHSVVRGVPPPSVPSVLEGLQKQSGLKAGALFTPIVARPPLPLADPFPRRIFGRQPLLSAIPLSTSLSTSSSSRHLLAHLIANVAEFGRVKADVRVLGMGDAVGRDEVREVEEGLRALWEGYAEEDEDDLLDEVSGDERD